MSDSSVRHLFPRAVAGGYLDTAAEGLPAPGVADALNAYFHEKEKGTPGRHQHFAKETEARELAARLLDAPASQVTFAPSSSDALNTLAASLPLSSGDEVIITDLEFPSNVLPWLALRQRGVDVRVVRSRGGQVHTADVLEAVSERTRLVSLSSVSYKTGALFTGIPDVADAVHRIGGFLCVDATQALGRCPVSIDGVDYLLASTFKWLMSPHGLAVVYLSESLRSGFQPTGVGWYSVTDVFTPDRFDRYELKAGAAFLSAGMPNFASLYALCESLRFLLSLPLAAEQTRVNRICGDTLSALREAGLAVITPQAEEFRSGITAFEHADAKAIGQALQEAGVTVWAGDGRVRASFHYYNDYSDAASYLEALARIVPGLRQTSLGVTA